MDSPQSPPSSPAPPSHPISPSLSPSLETDTDTKPGTPISIPIPIQNLTLNSPPSPPTTYSPPLDEDIYPPSPSLPPSTSLPSPSSSSNNHDPTSPTHSPQIEGSEIPRLRATHTTAGYRDGISASKELALQPGFDEGYPLGAVFGLRVGWVVGVLGGLVGALGGVASGEGEGAGGERDGESVKEGGNGGLRKGDKKGEWTKAYEESRQMWMRAREELVVERVFGREFWGEDGVWRYDVQKAGGDGEVTFQEVVEQHPLVKEWVERARGEMRRWGIREGVFEGEEWERGRIGGGERETAGG